MTRGQSETTLAGRVETFEVGSILTNPLITNYLSTRTLMTPDKPCQLNRLTQHNPRIDSAMLLRENHLIGFRFQCKVGSGLVLVRPIEATHLIGN